MSCVAEEFRDEMATAATRQNEIKFDPNWPPEVRKRCATLYAALASLTSGAPLNLIRSITSRSGFEGWRKLVQEYEPQTGTQQLSLLVQIIEGIHLKNASIDNYADHVRQWEEIINKYEQTTLDDVPDAVKRAVLLKFAPDTVQAHI